MRRAVPALFVLLLLLFGTAACSQQEAQDTADEAVEDVGEAAEDVGEEVADEAQEAADAAEELINDRNVHIEDFAYQPENGKVKMGVEVTWINRDDVGHTVTADDGAFESETIGENDEFSFRFTQEGTYDYHCEVHGEDRMSGSITVE